MSNDFPCRKYLLQLYTVLIWTRQGSTRFLFSTKGELLPDWGRGMRKFTLNIFTLSLGLAVMPMVEAAPTAQQQLLEQVRLGEATHREDPVQQSLYRWNLLIQITGRRCRPFPFFVTSGRY